MFHFVSSKQSLSLSLQVLLLWHKASSVWSLPYLGSRWMICSDSPKGDRDTMKVLGILPKHRSTVWEYHVWQFIYCCGVGRWLERLCVRECVVKTHFYLTGLLLPHILDPVHTSDWWWSDRILLADRTGWKRVRVYFLMDVQSSFPVVVNIQYIW